MSSNKSCDGCLFQYANDEEYENVCKNCSRMTDESCSCHLNPPCNACVTDYYQCDQESILMAERSILRDIIGEKKINVVLSYDQCEWLLNKLMFGDTSETEENKEIRNSIRNSIMKCKKGEYKK